MRLNEDRADAVQKAIAVVLGSAAVGVEYGWTFGAMLAAALLFFDAKFEAGA